MLRTAFFSAAVLLLLGSPAQAQGDLTESDPWELLTQVREEWREKGPLGSDFVQTFLPAGFQEGDRETGTVWIDLPACVRWDYEMPFPKTFLLCGNTAYHWIPGDPQGRRYRISGAQEPGLDLLLLDVEDLKTRYRAEPLTNGEKRGLRLETRELQTSGPVRAEIWLSLSRSQVDTLTYWDTEGNRTRFELTGHRPFLNRVIFNPPDGVTWVEE